MKFLEIASLMRLTALLTEYRVGDVVVNGRVECFSCKAAGADKKLAKELNAAYKEDEDVAATPVSPLGPMSETSTRRLLVNLIGTLSLSFPDYDFTTLKPDDFLRLRSAREAAAAANAKMASIEAAEGTGFLNSMWDTIDEVIKLNECEVYSYIPEVDDDPLLGEDGLWSFNYFFYNKAQKQILYITCVGSYPGDEDGAAADAEMGDERGRDGEAEADGETEVGDGGFGGSYGGAVQAAVEAGERDGPDVEAGALGWEDGAS